MKKIQLTLLILVLMAFAMPAHAQILDKLGKKMEEKMEEKLKQRQKKYEQKAEDKVDEKIDGALDKGEDAVEGSVKRDKSSDSSDAEEEEASAGLAGLLGAVSMGVDVDIQSAYQLNYVMNVKVESISEKETNGMTYEIGANTTDKSFSYMKSLTATSKGKTDDMSKLGFTIFEYDQSAMVMFMDEQQMYMATKFDGEAIEAYAESQQEETPDYSSFDLVKTGATKTVAGFKCEEYTMSTDDHDISYWLSEDADLAGFNPFVAMNLSSQDNAYEGFMPKGSVLEMEMKNKKVENKKDPHTMKWIVTAIDSSTRTISTSGYKSMGDMMKY